MSAEDWFPEEASKVDDLLKTLCDPQRREVISYFENHAEGRTTSLEELVDHVEGRMPTKTGEELRVTLYQVHLPKLQARGWLEFDAQRNRVTYHGRDDAEELLGAVLDLLKG